MKTFKRIVCIFLAVITVIGIFTVTVSAKSGTLNYLVIGDSIAKGFGLENPREAAYGRIVANTNGYNYINHGYTGCTTEDMIDFLINNETYREDVKWADIISISIGGNDFLLDNAVLLVIEGLLFKNGPHYRKIADNYYNNLSIILDEIHSLNPDAVILVQTLYNAWRSPVTSRVFAQAAQLINDSIYRLHDEEGGFYIVDVASAFALDGSKDLITSDTIHPTFKGNVIIARKVLEKLYELGLGENTEPVILAEGIDRDYFNEFFPYPLGPVIIFIANLATGNLF